MRALGFGVVLAVLGLAACATTRPPGIRVTDVSRLAGTYHGTLSSYEMADRPARLVVAPDGGFEITVPEPAGFRFVGHLFATDDGNLAFDYDQDRNQGRGFVYEGGGRRTIVLERADGRASASPWTRPYRSRPPHEAVGRRPGHDAEVPARAQR